MQYYFRHQWVYIVLVKCLAIKYLMITLRLINYIILLNIYFCRNSSKSWLSSIVMWGIIAVIAYYIYQRLSHNPAEQYPCTCIISDLCHYAA